MGFVLTFPASAKFDSGVDEAPGSSGGVSRENGLRRNVFLNRLASGTRMTLSPLNVPESPWTCRNGVVTRERNDVWDTEAIARKSQASFAEFFIE